MKWTDKDIDKLYSEGSERLAFEYKEGYWDEFDGQFSEIQDADRAKEPLSDAAIDSMYAASSTGLAFDYKNDYWNEFDASLPQGTPVDPPKPALTDIEIDAMYAASAAGLSFDYSDAYWKDFNASFPSDGVLTDNGIDGLYQESAGDLSFEYQPSYWEEFKGRIRRQRRPDFLWFVTAYSFVGVLGIMAFMGGDSVIDSKKLTADSDRIETQKNNSSNSQSKNENSSTSRDLSAATNSGTTSPANSVENRNGILDPSGTLLPSGSQLIEPITRANTPVVQAPVKLPVVAETPVTPETLPTPIVLIGQDPDSNAPSPNGTPENRVLVDNVTDPLLNGDEHNNPKGINSTQHLSPDQLAASETGVQAEEEVRLPYRSYDPLDLSIPSLAPLPGSPLSFNRGAFVVGYVQGIGGLCQSLVIPSDEISNSFGIGIGTEVHKGNFTFNFGVNALVENHNDLVLNRTAKVYGFGSDVYQFKIDYKQIYTLEAMIGVGYNLGRHRIDLGIRPSLAMSSRVHIEEVGSSTTEFASDNDYNESRDVFGFMDGLHRFGVKPTIGYIFKVSPSISLGGNIGVELMPSINEGFINGVNNTLPIDGQIYIRKTLSFRKK